MFVIDPDSSVAPYQQIKDQISSGREDGSLVAGFRLPPVRRLAAKMDVAANTVARAYRELEAAGVIETRGRAGSFVTGTQQTAAKAARAAAREYLATVRSLGLSEQDAQQALSEALADEN